MPKLICVKCKVHLTPEHNGNPFVELADDGQPYQIWDADRWKCPRCNYEILAGFGQQSIAIHHEPHFDDILFKVRQDPSVIEAR